MGRGRGHGRGRGGRVKPLFEGPQKIGKEGRKTGGADSEQFTSYRPSGSALTVEEVDILFTEFNSRGRAQGLFSYSSHRSVLGLLCLFNTKTQKHIESRGRRYGAWSLCSCLM